MSKSRVVLVASPVAGDEQELERYRTAQLISTIRAELDAQWVGWGPFPAKHPQDALSSGLSHSGAVSALDLSAAEVTAIRDQVSQRMLWPVLQGRADLMQFDADAYEIFLSANCRLGRALSPHLHDGDQIWVHDYLHAPFASALRDEGFAGVIGFLLHTPFPSADQMAALPVHKEFVSQLCCFNLLGFQTEACRSNFHEAAERCLSVNRHSNASNGVLQGPFGRVETYVSEIPGNTQATARTAATSAVQRSEHYLRKCGDGRDLIGSFATLDPGQGIVERLQSFEVLLGQSPELCGRISMVQITLPHRHWLEDDDDVGAAVEQEFMRINGRFATFHWTPIRYFHKLLPPDRLTALYRSVRVGLIAPMREGVNLATKDFVAAQNPVDPGILIASNVAGGSRLSGAFYVNPFDVEGIATALNRALRVPLPERQARLSSMMNALEAQDMESWCRDFIAQLMRSRPVRPAVVPA
ncbi:MAG: trehalose-6-phosphate synthase [Hyphomicrobiaceae bacterium]